MTQPNMRCKELVEVVTDYLEGKMNQEEAARFEAHLAKCAGCQTYIDQMKEVIRLTGAIPVEALSHETAIALLEVIKASREQS